jgi:hypothetical protein
MLRRKGADEDALHELHLLAQMNKEGLQEVNLCTHRVIKQGESGQLRNVSAVISTHAKNARRSIRDARFV